jgi:hypothetical protein
MPPDPILPEALACFDHSILQRERNFVSDAALATSIRWSPLARFETGRFVFNRSTLRHRSMAEATDDR